MVLGIAAHAFSTGWGQPPSVRPEIGDALVRDIYVLDSFVPWWAHRRGAGDGCRSWVVHPSPTTVEFIENSRRTRWHRSAG